ncbi:nitrilase-related carbon-nitrogen hydrolase [Nitriliruptor alkaliphilus]|uniref:nitrilase-related carbon-nitrogen hydrolase n=1 Tax=Nitriliruptor alkaliphilus TaxID=427918 RepID=UPI001B80C0D3|nr:nitrilase-related carbon-nitrogen hydrolase [Nitriliruptor alkaliphilus]
MTTLRVAAVQHVPAWQDRDATLAALTPTVAVAASTGARVVVLPEMFAVGFTMAVAQVAEPEDGPTVTWMREQAADLDVWVVGSIPEVRPGDERPGNVCCLVAPDGTVHRYAKRHPFGMADEPAHYRAGDTHVTVDVDGVRVTPTVCYDLRFPEQYRATADDTDAYLVVASWPAPRAQHWSALLVARAIENQAYVVGVNRVGVDGNGLEQAGRSVVVDPLGQELVRAGDAATILSADLDTDLVAQVRRDLPFLADRRADELPST